MNQIVNYKNLTFLIAEYDDVHNTSVSVFCNWDVPTPEPAYVVYADSVTVRGEAHDVRRWLLLTGHAELAQALEDPK